MGKTIEELIEQIKSKSQGGISLGEYMGIVSARLKGNIGPFIDDELAKQISSKLISLWSNLNGYSAGSKCKKIIRDHIYTIANRIPLTTKCLLEYEQLIDKSLTAHHIQQLEELRRLVCNLIDYYGQSAFARCAALCPDMLSERDTAVSAMLVASIMPIELLRISDIKKFCGESYLASIIKEIIYVNDKGKQAIKKAYHISRKLFWRPTLAHIDLVFMLYPLKNKGKRIWSNRAIINIAREIESKKIEHKNIVEYCENIRKILSKTEAA